MDAFIDAQVHPPTESTVYMLKVEGHEPFDACPCISLFQSTLQESLSFSNCARVNVSERSFPLANPGRSPFQAPLLDCLLLEPP